LTLTFELERKLPVTDFDAILRDNIGSVNRDVNKNKFQNPRPTTWYSLSRPKPTWASCPRPMPRIMLSRCQCQGQGHCFLKDFSKTFADSLFYHYTNLY